MKRQLAFILFISLFATYVFLSTLIVVGCGDGGGRGVGVVAPPSRLLSTINTRGGDGGRDDGDGGWGGYVTLWKFGGDGPVEVLSSGTVDASFTPTAAAPDTGLTPVDITADKTIPLDPVFPGGDPGADEPYMVSGDTSLYISDGDDDPADDVTATGLSVAAGATLTLPLNIVDPDMGPTATIWFTNDVENNGTITTLDGPTRRGSLSLTFFSYYGGSAIDTSGTDPGQNGGDIVLWSGGSATAGFYNRGAINTAGADNPGGAGGNGGFVLLAGYDPFENTGPITTAGGEGGTGNGGAGGDVFIGSGVDYLYNSGAINSTGGDGTGSGGWGGDVLMASAVVLDTGYELRNSGAVRSGGGNGAGGPGGAGGHIALVALGADLRNNAALNSAGGDSSDPDWMSWGGDGGDIYVLSVMGEGGIIFPLPDPLQFPDKSLQGDNLLLAGNIDSSGGNALASGQGGGGWGGDVWVLLDASGSWSGVFGLPAPTNQRLALFSHSNIDTSGGSGNQGGPGGIVDARNEGERWDGGVPGFVDDVGGDVTNQAAVTTRGGSVAAGATTTPAWGGVGGDVFLYGDTDLVVTNPDAERANNSGRIDTSGGHSLALDAPPGRNAGGIDLWTTNDATNTGAVTANGGSDAVNDDTLGTGFGAGGGLFLWVDSILATGTNSGAINANGGDGETLGGAGAGLVFLGSVQVVNSGNISVRGGNADVALAGSVGGDGGDIVALDVDVPDNTGTLDVSGGAGDTPGTDGTITP